jgi:hypothetical protein
MHIELEQPSKNSATKVGLNSDGMTAPYPLLSVRVLPKRQKSESLTTSNGFW